MHVLLYTVLVTVSAVQRKTLKAGADFLLPKSNIFMQQMDLITETFSQDPSVNYILIVEDDVLSTSNLQAMSEFDKK